MSETLFEVNDFVYRVNQDTNSAEIVRYTGHSLSVEIPAAIEGHPVRALLDRAFADNQDINVVNIPNTVTTLGEGLFENCQSLQTLYMAGVFSTGRSVYVTNMESMAGFEKVAREDEKRDFGQLKVDVAYGKDGQYKIKYGVSGVVTFDNATFGDPILNVVKDGWYRPHRTEEIVIPDSMLKNCGRIRRIRFSELVVGIGKECLADCGRLEEVAFLSTGTERKSQCLTDIPERMLSNCRRLERIEFSSNIANIGEAAFWGCTYLQHIQGMEHIRIVGKCAFDGCVAIKSICLSWGTTLMEKAFAHCMGLRTVKVPESFARIDKSAFDSCEKLTEIVLPPDIQEIGEEQLLFRKKLDSVVITGSVLPKLQPQVYDILKKVRFFVSEQLFNTVEAGHIDRSAYGKLEGISWYSCMIIREPGGLKLLRYHGSNTCVKIPDTVKGIPVVSIGRELFKNHAELEEVLLPDSIEVIGIQAFFGCQSLTYLLCPPKVKRLEAGAVDGCSSLRALTFLAQGAQYDKQDFRDCEQLKYITINGKTEGADPKWADRSKFTVKIVEQRAVITDYKGYDDDKVISEADYHTLFIPEIIDGYPVVQVGEESSDFNQKGVFAGCEELRGVSIPPSVKKIGTKAFYHCTNLETLNLPKSVEYLAESSFRACTALVSINLQAKRLELGDRAFSGCSSLKAAAIWAKEINVGTDCFADCEQLKTIYFHSSDGVTFLGESEHRIGVITEVVTVSQTEVIEEGAYRFRVSKEEQEVSIQKYIGTDEEKRVVMPDYLKGLPVRRIGYDAFKRNKVMVCVEIGKTVKYIEMSVFRECSSLAEVVLPQGLRSIEHQVFYGCKELERVVLPDSLEIIGDQAFFGCEKLQEIVLPADLHEIRKEAFCGCTSLEKLVFNQSLKEIGESAFAGCCSLRHIMLPPEVKSVKRETFKDCTKLRSVLYQNPACTKEAEAFAGCCLASEAVCEKVPQESIVQDCISYHIDTTTGEAVLCGCQAWGGGKLAIPSYVNGYPVTAIADIAFLCNKELTGVLIGENIRVINSMAFYGCENLEEIVFLHEDKGPRICKEAFHALDRGVIYLTSEQSYAALNEDNCSCPVFCIQDSYSAADIHYTYHRDEAALYIAAGKEGTADLMDNDMKMEMDKEDYPWHFIRDKIRTVCMEGDITCVHDNCFADCRNLQKVIFADQVQQIGKAAFKNCRALSEIVLPVKLECIGDEAFFHCENLTGTSERAFQFPKNLRRIGKRAFFGCLGFQYLVFPKSVQEIAARAFQRCEKLTEIYMEHEKKPGKIGGKVFYEAAEGCELSVKFTDSSMLEEKFDHKVIIHVPVEGECGKKEKSIFWKLYYDGLLEFTGSGEMADYDGITTPWNAYAVQVKRIVIGKGITYVGAMAFHSCNVARAELPEGLVSIGREAFAHCVNLSDIELPASVMSVGRDCFTGCHHLKK